MQIKSTAANRKDFFDKQFSDCACVSPTHVLTETTQNNTDEDVIWPMTGLSVSVQILSKITTKEKLVCYELKIYKTLVD